MRGRLVVELRSWAASMSRVCIGGVPPAPEKAQIGRIRPQSERTDASGACNSCNPRSLFGGLATMILSASLKIR